MFSESTRRVSVTVFDLDNPYHSVEIRGTAQIAEDPAKVNSFSV